MEENRQPSAEKDCHEQRQLLTEAMLRKQGRTPDVDVEWERVQGRISPSRSWRGLSPYYIYSGIAAAVLALFVIVPMFLSKDNDVLVYEASATPRTVVINTSEGSKAIMADTSNYVMRKAQRAEMMTMTVPEGKTHCLTLSDGTRVWLNARTRITYPSVFTGAQREVSIEGEAYFKVARDAAHPFIVNAGSLTTKVLGTEFNVNSYDARTVSVTLASGRVSVSNTASGHGASLLDQTGETATASPDGLHLSMLNIDDVTSWREGIILFDDSSLCDVLMHIGSWYNMTVICRDKAQLAMRLHCVYDRNMPIDETLDILEKVSNIKFRVENNTIFID